MQKVITVKTHEKCELIDITGIIIQEMQEANNLNKENDCYLN